MADPASATEFQKMIEATGSDPKLFDKVRTKFKKIVRQKRKQQAKKVVYTVAVASAVLAGAYVLLSIRRYASKK